MRSPKTDMATGTGIKITEMRPRSEFPQPRPNALYIGRPTSGTRAPTMERQIALAASAEAACVVKASRR